MSDNLLKFEKALQTLERDEASSAEEEEQKNFKKDNLYFTNSNLNALIIDIMNYVLEDDGS